jgi:multidrug efflux pump subunit AcrB
LALENLASARYLASSVARPVSKAVGGLSHQIQRMSQNNQNRSTLQQRMTAGAQADAATKPSQRPTTQLAKQTPINAFGVQRTKGLNGGGRGPTTKL